MGTKKRFFHDFYGGTATIAPARGGGFRLKMAAKFGPVHTNKVYRTFRGARSAMSRSSDGWNEATHEQ